MEDKAQGDTATTITADQALASVIGRQRDLALNRAAELEVMNMQLTQANNAMGKLCEKLRAQCDELAASIEAERKARDGNATAGT